MLQSRQSAVNRLIGRAASLLLCRSSFVEMARLNSEVTGSFNFWRSASTRQFGAWSDPQRKESHELPDKLPAVSPRTPVILHLGTSEHSSVQPILLRTHLQSPNSRAPNKHNGWVSPHTPLIVCCTKHSSESTAHPTTTALAATGANPSHSSARAGHTSSRTSPSARPCSLLRALSVC